MEGEMLFQQMIDELSKIREYADADRQMIERLSQQCAALALERDTALARAEKAEREIEAYRSAFHPVVIYDPLHAEKLYQSALRVCWAAGRDRTFSDWDFVLSRELDGLYRAQSGVE